MSSSAEHVGSFCRRAWLCGTATALLRIPAAAQTPMRLSPPRDPPADPGLQLLLARMRKIVDSRDATALAALLSPTFRVEFDAGKGPQAFRRHWKPETRESPVWEVLGSALAVQGAFCLPSLFCLPYVYLKFPRDLDPLAYVVAVSAGATLRKRPDTDGAVVGRLDHSIIRVSEPLVSPVIIPSNKFLAVDDATAGHCYIAGSDVYSPAAHRMFFERANGKWRWISLVAATFDAMPLKRQTGEG